MRTLTILTFAAFIAVPTFVAAQSMTAQQYHREKGPSLISRCIWPKPIVRIRVSRRSLRPAVAAGSNDRCPAR